MTDHLAIGQFANVLRGTVPANISEIPTVDRFFGIAEISSGGVLKRSPASETDLAHVIRLQENDVVVALLGRVGDVAIVNAEAEGAVLGRECAAIRLREGETRVCAEWLIVVMRSTQFRGAAGVAVGGVTMPRLSVKALTELTIPIPSLQTQHAIAHRVRSIGAALDAHRELVEALGNLRDTEIDLAVANPQSVETPQPTIRKIATAAPPKKGPRRG